MELGEKQLSWVENNWGGWNPLLTRIIIIIIIIIYTIIVIIYIILVSRGFHPTRVGWKKTLSYVEENFLVVWDITN